MSDVAELASALRAAMQASRARGLLPACRHAGASALALDIARQILEGPRDLDIWGASAAMTAHRRALLTGGERA